MERARLKEVKQADPWMIAEVVGLERFSSDLSNRSKTRQKGRVTFNCVEFKFPFTR